MFFNRLSFDRIGNQVRKAVSVLLLIGLGIGVLTFRLWSDGKRHLEAAELAGKSGSPWQDVVSLYEDAAKTYFPGNPYSSEAMWKLSILAKSAQMRAEQRRARYIWEVVRRSAVSQRHFFQPYASYVKEAERQLQQQPSKQGRSKVIPVIEALDDPDPWASIGVFIGLLTWILAASAAIFSKGHRAIGLFGTSLLGAILWIVAALVA